MVQPMSRILKRVVVCAVLLALGSVVWVLQDHHRRAAWLYRRAMRLAAPVLADPAAATPADTTRALGHFLFIVRNTPGSAGAARALNEVGRMAMAQGRYADAREALEPLCAAYYGFAELCMSSRVLIGRCYEAEGDLDAAAKTYSGMKDFHPWSALWYEAPLYIGQLYARHGRREEAMAAYREAEHLTNKRLASVIDQDVVEALQWQLVMTAEGLADWPKAIERLEQMLARDRWKVSPRRPDVLFELARLKEEHLGEPVAARAAYHELVKSFPDHPSAARAAAAIRQFERRDEPAGR